MIPLRPQNIVISRTDSIGDVVLTLPMAGLLKKLFPGIYIGFIGRNYTRPVIEACSHVDEFIDRQEFLAVPVLLRGNTPDCIIHVFPDAAIAWAAMKRGIGFRIGTTNRAYHWATCNKLVRLSRRHSDLHEAQLNLQLLRPLGFHSVPALREIAAWYGMSPRVPLTAKMKSLLQTGKLNIILHPKSQGSAREWGLDNFAALVALLDKTRYQVFISGTSGERKGLDDFFAQVSDSVIDITGAMPLDEFIAFIAQSDGLVANSTGPLHIAAAVGVPAFGIYAPLRPVHPGRWAPVGTDAHALVLHRVCSECRKSPAACHCIKEVTPQQVASAIYRAEAGRRVTP